MMWIVQVVLVLWQEWQEWQDSQDSLAQEAALAEKGRLCLQQQMHSPCPPLAIDMGIDKAVRSTASKDHHFVRQPATTTTHTVQGNCKWQ